MKPYVLRLEEDWPNVYLDYCHICLRRFYDNLSYFIVYCLLFCLVNNFFFFSFDKIHYLLLSLVNDILIRMSGSSFILSNNACHM